MTKYAPTLCAGCRRAVAKSNHTLLPKHSKRVLEIFEEAALMNNIPLGRLTGHDSSRGVSRIRKEMLRRARDETGASTTLLGRLCGDRDHSTISYLLGNLAK